MPAFALRPLPADQLQVIESARVYCKQLIEQASDERYTYHNWEHTDSVVRVAGITADLEKLSDEEYLPLMLAALFHDSGYYEQRDGHEEIGARNALHYLESYPLAEDIGTRVQQLILETKLSAKPTTEASKILRDADLHYVGLERGLTIAEQLRTEWEALDIKHFNEHAWLANNIDFFESHRFFTSTAKTSFGPGKARNLQRLRSRLDQL